MCLAKLAKLTTFSISEEQLTKFLRREEILEGKTKVIISLGTWTSFGPLKNYLTINFLSICASLLS